MEDFVDYYANGYMQLQGDSSDSHTPQECTYSSLRLFTLELILPHRKSHIEEVHLFFHVRSL